MREPATTSDIERINALNTKARTIEAIARAAATVAPLHTKNSDEFVDRLLAVGIEAIGGPEAPAPTIETKAYVGGVNATGTASPAASPRSDSVFEAEVQAKGLTAPRLTPADLEAVIGSMDIVKFVAPSGQILRWAVLTCLNGYAVTGAPSVSVSPENDDEVIGERIAAENAKRELWSLLGYELKSKLSDARERARVDLARVRASLEILSASR